MRLSSVTFIGVIIYLFLVTCPVKAFGIRPAKFSVVASPGIPGTIVLTIKNSEVNAVKYSARILGAHQNVQGFPIFGNKFDDAENWIKPDVSNLTIPAGAERSILFKILVPQDAKPDLHYLGIAVAPYVSASSTVGVNGQLVALVSLQVAGIINEKLLVSACGPKSNFQISPIWNLAVKLKNLSNISVITSGQVTVANWANSVVAKQDLITGNAIVPDSVRELIRPSVNVSSIFWPGVYSVKCTLTYGQLAQTSTLSSSVFYIPRWLIVLLLIIFCAIILVLKRYHYRYVPNNK